CARSLKWSGGYHCLDRLRILASIYALRPASCQPIGHGRMRWLSRRKWNFSSPAPLSKEPDFMKQSRPVDTKSSSLIEVRDLCVSYGGSQALRNVSLHVDQGELITVIGAN